MVQSEVDNQVDKEAINVHVDLNYPEDDLVNWFWTTRSMERVSEDTPQPEHCLEYAAE